MAVLRRMTTMVGVLALAGGLAFAGVAVATAATRPMPERQWRKTVNNICAQSQTLIEEAANTALGGLPRDEQPSLEQMTALVTAIEPIIQQQIDSIDALNEPTKFRRSVKQLLKTAQAELDAFVADPSRGLDGNPFSGANLASKKLKLPDCAN
jgi:hypothetical protein